MPQFRLDMSTWPVEECEFLFNGNTGAMYRVIEFHESRRTPRRLMIRAERCDVPLAVIADSPHIVFERYKRK